MTCKMNCRIQKCHRIMAIPWIYNVAMDRVSAIHGSSVLEQKKKCKQRQTWRARACERRMEWNMESHRKCICIGILIYFHCINLKKELKPKKNKKKIIRKCKRRGNGIGLNPRARCQLPGMFEDAFIPRLCVREHAKPHAHMLSAHTIRSSLRSKAI